MHRRQRSSISSAVRSCGSAGVPPPAAAGAVAALLPGAAESEPAPAAAVRLLDGQPQLGLLVGGPRGRPCPAVWPVTPWEAALGARVPLTTPGGTAKVNVPPGSSTGRRLRLRGEGMPHPGGKPGDLYAEIRVMVPPSPTPEERRLFEQLADASDFDPRSQGSPRNPRKQS